MFAGHDAATPMRISTRFHSVPRRAAQETPTPCCGLQRQTVEQGVLDASGYVADPVGSGLQVSSESFAKLVFHRSDLIVRPLVGNRYATTMISCQLCVHWMTRGNTAPLHAAGC